jgi:cobalt-zinc-cadmium efflux system protein
MPKGHPGDAALAELTHALDDTFGIDHATIQVEMEDLELSCKLGEGPKVRGSEGAKVQGTP